METNKFYINEEGITDVSIWKKAFAYALSLLKNDKSIERIVFYFSKKEKIEVWFDKKENKKFIDSLWLGMQNTQNNNVIFCARTAQTYEKDNCYNDIIISFGCVSSVLKGLDKYEQVKYIIAIPWCMDNIKAWKEENNPQLIENVRITN